MSTQGPKLPTAYTQTSGSWTTPANIESSTDSNATASISIAAKNTTYQLDVSNFGFATIDPGAVINSVSLSIRWYESSSSSATLGVRGLIGGSALADHTATTTGALAVSTFDITGDRSWTASDFTNANFKVRVEAEQGNTSQSRTYYYDYVTVTVDYTVNAAAFFNNTSGAFAANATVVQGAILGNALFAGAGDFEASPGQFIGYGGALLGGYPGGGPWQSSGGDFYQAFLIAAMGVVSVRIFKAANGDPTGFWYPCAEKTIPNNFIFINYKHIGDTVHICYSEAPIWGGTYLTNYHYVPFDLSTATFGSDETALSGIDVRTNGNSVFGECALDVRSNGNVVMLVNNRSGYGYLKATYTERTAANTWSAPVNVAPTDNVDYWRIGVAVGASDAVHFIFMNGTTYAIHQRTLSSGNVLQTASTPIVNITEAQWPPRLSKVVYGGTTYLTTPVSDTSAVKVGALIFTSVNTPTLSFISSGVDATTIVAQGLFIDGSTIHLLLLDSTDNDNSLVTTMDVGATWTDPFYVTNDATSGYTATDLPVTRSGRSELPILHYDAAHNDIVYLGFRPAQQIAAAFSGSGALVADARLPTTMVAGVYSESGVVTSYDLAAGAYTEFEFGVEIDASHFSSGDHVDFVLYVGGQPLASYDQTPEITVTVTFNASALLAGAGSLSATGRRVQQVVNETRFAGIGAFASAASHTAYGSILVPGVGAFASAALHTPVAAGLFAGAATLLSDASSGLFGNAAFSGASALAVSARWVNYVAVAVTFSGASSVGAAARWVSVTNPALLSGASAVAAAAVQTDAARALLASGSALAANAGHSPSAAANLANVSSALAADAFHVPNGEARFTVAGEVDVNARFLLQLRQKHFRFRTDALAVDAAPSWGSDLDESFDPGTQPFRLRLSVVNDGGHPIDLAKFQIFASKNGGEYAAVTTISGAGVVSVNAGSDADDTPILIPRLGP